MNQSFICVSFPLSLGRSAAFLGLLACSLPVCFQIIVGSSAFELSDSHSMSLRKSAYLCLAQSVEFHDVEAGVAVIGNVLTQFFIIKPDNPFHIFFLEAGRSPCMNRLELVTVSDFIESAILDIKGAQHLCHRVMGIVCYSIRCSFTSSGSLATLCRLVD